MSTLHQPGDGALHRADGQYMFGSLERRLLLSCPPTPPWQVLKEKIDMENQLEQEQEYIVNRLQKRLEAVESDKRCGQ